VLLDLAMPYLLSEVPVCIGASAGILLSDGRHADGGTAQLLEQVDRALYTAKRAGGGYAWSDGEPGPDFLVAI